MHKFICISGCTASGKSSFAIELSNYFENPVIVNADALQVYDCWEILTDRPTEKKTMHDLYGHVSCTVYYSVGDWLKDVKNLFDLHSNNSKTFIFVGGTGLYFKALLNGLSQIPRTPEEIRDFANSCDVSFFLKALNINDPDIFEKIDIKNRQRVQRAWEVLEATGKSILYWQSKNTSPLISISNATLLLVELEKEGLADRINTRVSHMLECGVIKEVEKVYNTCWDKKFPFTKAIGAEDIVSYLNGEISFEKLFQKIALKTRQFAKRQRTWQRNYMKNWHSINTAELNRLDIKKIVKKVKANN